MVSSFGVKTTNPDKQKLMEKGIPVQDEFAKQFGLTELLKEVRNAKKF
jgi:hypothetical protein